MSDLQYTLWLILAVIGIIGTGLCAGLEIGVYRLNRIRLHLMDHQGRPAARILTRLLRDRTTVLTTLLIGANVASYVASSATSVIIDSYGLSDWGTIAVVCLIVTPLLFIFAETLPKDLFAAHADVLVYPFARLLLGMRWLFTVVGLLPLIRLGSELFLRLIGAPRSTLSLHPRHQVTDLLKESVGYGLVSDEQSALVERALALAGRSVSDEMVPWRRVVTIRVDQPQDSLWKLAQDVQHSRFPVVDAAGQVVGVISLYDALIHEPSVCPPIAELMQPPFRLEARTPSRVALGQVRQQPMGMAIVTDRGRLAGIATVKDLVEPITGELANW